MAAFADEATEGDWAEGEGEVEEGAAAENREGLREYHAPPEAGNAHADEEWQEEWPYPRNEAVRVVVEVSVDQTRDEQDEVNHCDVDDGSGDKYG